MRGSRAAAVLAVLALAGCTTAVPGEPGTPGSSAAPSLPGPGVPRVAHPRDARHIAACDLLTPAQVEGFGLDPATAKSSEQNSGLRCEWRTRDKLGSVEAVVAAELVANGFIGGLSGLYASRDSFGVFEPGELDGFPIVHADRNKTTISCTIYFGSADDQLLFTGAGYAAGHQDPCDISRRMASAVLSNLPPLT